MACIYFSFCKSLTLWGLVSNKVNHSSSFKLLEMSKVHQYQQPWSYITGSWLFPSQALTVKLAIKAWFVRRFKNQWLVLQTCSGLLGLIYNDWKKIAEPFTFQPGLGLRYIIWLLSHWVILRKWFLKLLSISGCHDFLNNDWLNRQMFEIYEVCVTWPEMNCYCWSW